MITERNLFSYALLTSIFVGAYAIAPLLSVKVASVGPFTLPAGDFIYALTFLATDITNEVYGRKYARNIVACGLITLIIVNLGTQAAIALPAAEFWDKQEAYNSILGSSFRIFLATVSAYVISQFADIFIFSYIRRKTNARFLWLRNNISTFISRLLDIVTFVLVAFYGVYDNDKLVDIIISGYVAGLIVSVLDTPFAYLGVRILRKIHPDLQRA